MCWPARIMPQTPPMALTARRGMVSQLDQSATWRTPADRSPSHEPASASTMQPPEEHLRSAKLRRMTDHYEVGGALRLCAPGSPCCDCDSCNRILHGLHSTPELTLSSAALVATKEGCVHLLGGSNVFQRADWLTGHMHDKQSSDVDL